MSSLKTFAFAGAVLVGATVSASAADFGGRHHAPPPPPVPVATPIVEASGWYLRGDIGVGHQSMKPKLEDSRFPTTPVVNTFDFSQSKVPFAGIGAGYQWNSWLRTDVTAEYRFRSDYSFTDKSCQTNNALGAFVSGVPGVPCNITPGFNGVDRRNYYNGRITSAVVMFNAYLDLGNWSGFTPYIGAGVGYASNTVARSTDIGINNSYAAGVLTGVSSSGLVTFKDRTQGSVAYALMAGVGYDLSPSAKLDLGYRYINLGKVRQYVFDCTGGPGVAGTCGDYLNHTRIHAHEFRLGLRYMFGGATQVAAAPVYHPGHVVKRY
jgi:opacity protein-like surface antigen